MLEMRFILVVGAGWLFVSMQARADVEADLLQKFQRQNQTAAQKLKQEVESHLAQAAGMRSAYPEKAQDLLRQSLGSLQQDSLLPKGERTALVRRVQDQLKEVKERLALKKEHEEKERQQLAASLAKKISPQPGSGIVPVVKPPFFTPIITPVPTSVNMQVSPVVSPDRRFVRIGVSGAFSIPKVSWIALPVATPTILQGPGNRLTVTNPVVVNYQMVPFVTFTNGFIDTTVVAPDGGTAVVGGFSTRTESSAEFGTPILGHIPYLGRLFRNRTYGSSSSSFQINVSPRIIVLEEEDQRALGNLPPLPGR